MWLMDGTTSFRPFVAGASWQAVGSGATAMAHACLAPVASEKGSG
jgi:hypothetical protein